MFLKLMRSRVGFWGAGGVIKVRYLTVSLLLFLFLGDGEQES